MLDVSCAVLPDLGERAENEAANRHALAHFQGSGPSKGGLSNMLEQSPLVMKAFVLEKRMGALKSETTGVLSPRPGVTGSPGRGACDQLGHFILHRQVCVVISPRSGQDTQSTAI